ncbi:MFS transporter [Bifidobacterium mongoliense]|uniref:Proline/betaine transporter n=1 Tax=Bifidobacterium mongoliense DSM 21395 TaxID=1437603 RepID=A0A087BWW1_9BIFI|nr:MFS transporter [Bifidobacterium mongoliense]KFI75511.1 proline/betaine transporter [Bifidobacterium mongoliense DSM 21395]
MQFQNDVEQHDNEHGQGKGERGDSRLAADPPRSARGLKTHHWGGMRLPRLRRLRQDDIVVVEQEDVRHAVLGTAVGNFMEWFDFGIYGYLTIVMTTVFTQGMPRSIGLLVMLLGFAVSFLARPLGGFILGPLGDRIGRQKVLFATMSVMALSTSLIGVMPSAAQIGLWAPIPLYVLKIIQGFSTGGEYAGAATYVSEFSPDKRRGYYSSWLDVGSYLGFACGAGAVALTTYVSQRYWGPDAMVNGGWRIPFFMAVPLGALAIYLRVRIPETPHFEEEGDAEESRPRLRRRGRWSLAMLSPEARDKRVFGHHGTMGLLRNFHREIILGIMIVAAGNTVSYTLTSYMPTYLGNEMGAGPVTSAAATIPVLVLVAVLLPIVGALSDRIGRRPVFTMAVVGTLVLMLPAFMLLHTHTSWGLHLGLVLVALPTSAYICVMASAIPALFPTSSRFAGMAAAYNVGVSLFGGTAPLIIQALIEATGNRYVPAWYAMFFACIGGVAIWMVPETSGKHLMGSMPAVETRAEAATIVATQDDIPAKDLHTMPVEAIAAAWKEPDRDVHAPVEGAEAAGDAHPPQH